jgi:hypothetical protein
MMPLATPEDGSSDWLSAVDQRLALWSQQVATAFPSSSSGNGFTSPVGASEFAANQLTQLATTLANQQSASCIGG